jgi:hypothetical protein
MASQQALGTQQTKNKVSKTVVAAADEEGTKGQPFRPWGVGVATVPDHPSTPTPTPRPNLRKVQVTTVGPHDVYSGDHHTVAKTERTKGRGGTKACDAIITDGLARNTEAPGPAR